jgi:hypothetical protein
VSKNAAHRDCLPPEAGSALARLGEHLQLARLRRRESQREWAWRIGVSVPTLIRMERGDPGVGVGIYATALWMMGRASALAEIAEPQQDLGALESDVRAANRRRVARARTSIAAKLAREPGKP